MSTTSGNPRPEPSNANSSGSAWEPQASRLYSCSYTQKRIWYAQQMDPDSAHWNVGMRWRILGRLRDTTIERAWQYLIDRHEALRTTIEDLDGMPYQRVWDHYPFKLAVVDISRLPASQRSTAADDIARNDAIKPIPLSTTPPFRLQLIRMDENTAVLLTNFHNIIVDGWSVGILIREFGQAAANIEAGLPPDLPSPSMQHVDYALWQEDMLSSNSFDHDRNYWKKQLSNWKRFEVEPDRPRPPVMSHEGQIRTLLLPKAISDSMAELAKRQGVSMFHIGSATLAAILSNVSGNRDVFFGTQAACRDEQELTSLVGPLINTVALRFDASGDPTLVQLLKHCRQRCSEAIAHQHLPFNFVVEALKPARDPSRNLVYSITFTAQTAHIDTGEMGDLHFGDLTIAALPSFPSGAPTDLGFFMVGREEGWRLSCAGNTDLFDIATIDGLLDKWAKAIEGLVKVGDTLKLSELDAFPGATYRATGIGAQAETESASPSDTTGSIEEQVVATWKEVLDLPTVSRDADFFDVGGTSLTALRMLSRLGKSIGQSLPLVALLRNPKLSDFAEEIDRICAPKANVERQSAHAPKVAPQGDVARAVQPILALNLGSSFRFIGRHLKEEYPIKDIPVGTEEDLEFVNTRTFAEVVARVVDRIVAAQPQGPYVLLAYCAMNIVAYEAARQLIAQGRKVKLLIMINATAPYYHSSLKGKAHLLRRKAQITEALYYGKILFGMRLRGEITTEMLLQNYTFVRRIGLITLLKKLRLIQPTTEEATQQENLLDFPVLVDQRMKEGPRLEGRIDCNVAVYRSKEVLKGPAFPPAMGWPQWVTGDVHVHDVNVKHGEMILEISAANIAADLSSVLERLQDEDVK